MKRIRLCAFLAGCLAVLALLQALLMPKYTGDSIDGALIGEYYANAGGNDVLFIGDCEVYSNFSPAVLWEEYGIPSCIRGSPQQTIWQSYYLLEETLRYEIPDVVVFNVLSMQYDTPESTGNLTRREAYNRMALDSMRWSSSKVRSVFASMTEEENFLTYLFPILRYHDRWSRLTREDFSLWFQRPAVSHNGFLMQTGVQPVGDPYVQPTPADYRFGENSWTYLEKIRQLCAEKDIQLVLIKAPSLYPVWWPEWEEQICRYAEEEGLLYVNLLAHQEAIGLDWSSDTCDAGLHLNVFGAEKLSSWFGRYLTEHCSLPDRREDPETAARWEEKIKAYDNQKQSSEGE